MLDTHSKHENIWVEITKSEHGHGGTGWEFGTCLWSPSRNRSGHDRYSLMRQPKKGDLVLHFYNNSWPDGLLETRLCARSIIKKECYEVLAEPPSPGIWQGMSPYYRIDLNDFLWLDSTLSLGTLIQYYGDEIRREIIERRPLFYPFNTHGNSIHTVQGIYLAHCTTYLFLILKDALGIEELPKSNEADKEPNYHVEFSEGVRRSRESYFFTRNPKLAREAKKYYGYTCQACKFDFQVKYGELGKGYIECHHLNPLSERPEEEWHQEIRTKLSDVTVLCANCHRMIHKRKPALSLEDLKRYIRNS
jgi:hypothetical protein